MMMNKGEKRKRQERTIEERKDGWMWNGDEEDDFLRRGEDERLSLGLIDNGERGGRDTI